MATVDAAIQELDVAAGAACLHELFEMQADERPEQLALVCGDVGYTYQELEQRTNQLARYLREHWVGPGKLVGLYFDRSEKPIVAILAVLKAGAAYVPIDPVQPVERARHIVSESQVHLVLSERKLAAKAAAFFDGQVLAIDEQEDEIAECSAERLTREETGARADDLCYILYTSGSTGRPKGVMSEHRNVVRFTTAFNEVHQIGPDDRVFQGFALGFDGSVEEMWMAFSNGATLIVGTSDVVRFGDEVVRVFQEEQVTVFSTVPTFLSMIPKDVPSLRLVIVSGEPCPADLVRRWARPYRRMLNVYGPTETTVNSTVAECSIDRPVTIGRPLRGYQTYILDDRMQPAPPGEPGELYIGGVGVARGYFNQPELTEQHFVPNPFDGPGESSRLYRTGDLVALTDDGELQFLRRVDHQVKIRGYRVELAEVESVLREFPQVRQAVVDVFERDGLTELAAYVVPHDDRVHGTFDRDKVLWWLRDRLPPYMVPSYLDLVHEIPTLPSGKADRSRLPKPRLALVPSNTTVVGPANDIEQKIVGVWEKLLGVSYVSCADDFFLDLGGYSLLAAQMVSRLRSEHGLEVAIRDVYRHSTVQRLARHIAEANAASAPTAAAAPAESRRRSSREVFHSQWRLTRGICYLLQAVSVVLICGVASSPLLAAIVLVLAALQGAISLLTMSLLLMALIFVTAPLAICLTIVTKWLVIGRFKPGEYPLWSFYYFRWWLVSRVQALVPIDMYTGTPLMSLYFRLMGAKVGRKCIIDTSYCRIFDLVTIGDETSIGAEAQLLGYRVEDGLLKIGRVEIGSRCFVGTHCCLGLNTRMADDSYLDDMSLLADGAVIASGEGRRGSPAAPAEVSLPTVNRPEAGIRHPVWFGVLCFLASEVVGELILIAAVPPLVIVVATYLYFGLSWAVVATFVSIPLGVIAFCLLIAWFKRMILRRIRPGVYPVESWLYLRKWSADALLSSSGVLISMLFTTIYLPPWLRMLGAKIGRRAELSNVTIMSPDLMIIGDESFLADGAMVGGRRIFRGHVQFDFNRIGRRSFVGNSALLPVGTNLGDHCLLGVVSTPPDGVGSTVPDGTEWLGSPPFQLPFRKKVEGFDDRETFRPTWRLYLLRLVIDAMRILFPLAIGAAAALVYTAWVVIALTNLPIWLALLLVPLIASGVVLAIALTVVGVKQTLMGTFKPVIKPLWCPYVWFNEVVNGVYEGIGLPATAPLLGTPWFAWFLRMMGCKVGKHTFLETGLFSEFDLVEIGDYAALNLGAVVQNHLFEDRIMKSSYLKIGDECSVGNMAVVLYDSEMQQGSSLDALSLVMKGETLAPRTRWAGIPIQQL